MKLIEEKDVLEREVLESGRLAAITKFLPGSYVTVTRRNIGGRDIDYVYVWKKPGEHVRAHNRSWNIGMTKRERRDWKQTKESLMVGRLNVGERALVIASCPVSDQHWFHVLDDNGMIGWIYASDALTEA